MLSVVLGGVVFFDKFIALRCETIELLLAARDMDKLPRLAEDVMFRVESSFFKIKSRIITNFSVETKESS